jgi:hypothetical protein
LSIDQEVRGDCEDYRFDRDLLEEGRWAET